MKVDRNLPSRAMPKQQRTYVCGVGGKQFFSSKKTPFDGVNLIQEAERKFLHVEQKHITNNIIRQTAFNYNFSFIDVLLVTHSLMGIRFATVLQTKHRKSLISLWSYLGYQCLGLGSFVRRPFTASNDNVRSLRIQCCTDTKQLNHVKIERAKEQEPPPPPQQTIRSLSEKILNH